MKATLRAYYQLAKPGIIYGNLLTAVAGYLMASRWHIQPGVLAATLVGTSCIIGGACTFNNVMDREIDGHMERTRKRALVTKSISPRSALTYASSLTLIGFGLLVLFVPWQVALIGLIGFVDYVAAYGIIKRLSPLGTLVGSIAGATPITAGYVAATGHIDGTALILFLIMAIWQMPHFYAIAMYRRDDYKAAGIPVLAVKRGMHASKWRIMTYIGAFALACAALSIFGRIGWSFAVLMALVSAFWLYQGLRGLRGRADAPWARGMFGYSLIAMVVLSIALPIGVLLP